MDADRVVKAIVHYQQNLEKYIERRNEAKMIYCMEKLQRLPITVSHLENTGVGRTVNSVKKMKGIKASPKNTAKQLVQQWKKMVTEEELNEDDEEEASEQGDDGEDDEEDEDDSEDRLQIYYENDAGGGGSDEKEGVQEETRNIEMQHSSHYEESEEKYGKYRDNKDKYCDNDRIGFEHVNMDREETRETRIVKHTSPDCNDDDDYSALYGSSVDCGEVDRIQQCTAQVDGGFSADEVVERVNSSRERHDRKDDRSDRHKKHKKSSRERSIERSINCEQEKEKEKRRSKDGDRDRDKEKGKENHHHNGHHKANASGSDKQKERTDKNHKGSCSSKSGSTSREKEKENKDTSTRKDKDKEQAKDKSKDKRERESSRKSSTTPAPTSTTTSTSASTSSTAAITAKKRIQEESSKSTPSKKIKLSIQDGIDCESGASFAEALGMSMMMPSTSKARKDKDKERKDGCKEVKEVSKDRDKDRERKSRHGKDRKSDKERDKHKEKERDRDRERDKERKHDGREKPTGGSARRDEAGKLSSAPAALKAPPSRLTPLDDVGISNLLPQISTNYKPLGILPGGDGPRGSTRINDDEMLSKLMYAKNQRTKVYSGNKVFYGKVPSLFDWCIRLLQDNIDTLVLGYTGGVPYSILKPVLERATPNQLFSMEHYNTYLMEDSDELWRLHCQREFKTKQRNEMETWREMYLRCIDERDAKLKSLTANIKLSQDKSLPVRQTKLAYVDTIAKPPRHIAKKQAKNGISNTRPSVTPTSRLNQLALAGGADKISVPNPGSHRVNSGNGGGGSSGGRDCMVKPKKAPLMAKTLQLMKGRFRR